MKRIIALTAALIWMAVLALAQDPIAAKKNYSDLKGNKLLYLGTYDRCFDFVEGMGRVRVNNKSGFVDITGRLVVPIIYDFARDFCEGLAWVKTGDEWGYVNKKGEEVVPLIYAGAMEFSEGMGVVDNGNNREGSWLRAQCSMSIVRLHGTSRRTSGSCAQSSG